MRRVFVAGGVLRRESKTRAVGRTGAGKTRRSVRSGKRWPAKKHKRFTGGVVRWPSLCMPGSKLNWACGNFMCADCAKYEPKCSGPASPTTCSKGSGSDGHLTRLLRDNRARKATTRIGKHSRNAKKWASGCSESSHKDVFSQLRRVNRGFAEKRKKRIYTEDTESAEGTEKRERDGADEA